MFSPRSGFVQLSAQKRRRRNASPPSSTVGVMKSLFDQPHGYSVAQLVMFSVLSAVLAALCFSQLGESNGIPEQQGLASDRGTVASLEKYKYGVRFSLSGQGRHYNYPSKAKGKGVVLEALSGAGRAEVQVRYSPRGYSPLFKSEQYFDVWELAIDGRTIRTFQESTEGWRSDNAITPWLGAIFLLITLYFSVLAYRAKCGARGFQ